MSSKTFEQRLTEDRKLLLLRMLAELPGYRSNSGVLAMGLRSMGHVVSRDVVQAYLHWLAELNLVELEAMDGVTLVALSPYGHDVALGLTRVPGVARPEP